GAWRDDCEKKSFITTIEDLFGWAPNRERRGDVKDPVQAAEWIPRFNREKARDHEAHQGLVVFHDAFGEDPATNTPPRLEVDILTNHYSLYYQGAASPGDWHSPIPVSFLTIAAGTRFRFRVSKASSACSDDLLTVAKRLLLGGLHWLGAGAKTAAGYGWFDDAWKISEEAKQAQAGNVLADLIPQVEAKGQRLWKRTGDSTKKGASIQLDDSGAVIEGEMLELKNQSGAQVGQYVIIEPNPNSPSKWIPVRVVDELD
ncbi:MAG: type III-B CRISPR module RAMP protein Cmr6, partial [Planctomycetota bacterium]